MLEDRILRVMCTVILCIGLVFTASLIMTNWTYTHSVQVHETDNAYISVDHNGRILDIELKGE